MQYAKLASRILTTNDEMSIFYTRIPLKLFNDNEQIIKPTFRTTRVGRRKRIRLVRGTAYKNNAAILKC